jgi:hypothetical protein
MPSSFSWTTHRMRSPLVLLSLSCKFQTTFHAGDRSSLPVGLGDGQRLRFPLLDFPSQHLLDWLPSIALKARCSYLLPTCSSLL